jgi:MFS family permease
VTVTSADPPAFDRRLLAPLILGAILNPINSSIIAVALVPIGVAFGAPASQTAWLVSALYLATAIGQPLVGRLIDTFGPRRLYLVGTALTGVAGVLGMLAPDLGVLVMARVVLGFGTCAGYPAAMYLIRSEAGRTGLPSPAGVLTALSVSTQTIAVIGPTLGGLLIRFGGWRATFAVNVPLALACIVLGRLVLPRHTSAGERSGRPAVDLPGILLFAATLVALLLFLMDLHVSTLWLAAVAVLGGTAFAGRELRAEAPFIDLRVLAGNGPLLLTYLRALAAATVSYGFLYGFAQWLEGGRGLSPTAAGLVLLPTFGTGIVVAAVTGRRPQIRGKLLVGAVSQVIGCALLLLVDAGAGIAVLVGVAFLFGIPQGLVNLAVQNALYHQADPARIGASSGLLRTFAYLGAIISSAAGGAFFGVRAGTTGLHALAGFTLAAATVFLAVTVADRSLARVDLLAGAGPRTSG